MLWRVFVSAILVYLTLDFADPMMPGALNFDADQSVEVVYVKDVQVPAPDVAVSLLPHLDYTTMTEKLALAGRVVKPVTRVETVRIRGPRALVSESASSSPEDH
jgi:hypothetical protein